MKKYLTVDDYIADQTQEADARLAAIRKLIHKLVPDTEESIRYDMPAFTVGGHYFYMSANKDHIGIYAMYGIPELDKELLPYRGKGTKDSLHFQHNQPLPLELIEKIIEAKAALKS